MKKYYLLIPLLLTVIGVSAQSFDALKYQAIARDAEGNIITNQELSLKFEIVNLETEELVYEEIHMTSSNGSGLINLDVGLGESMYGTFRNIPWETNNLGVRTYIDMTGGNDFQLLGTETLRAVPYAIHAKSADYINNEENGTENYNNDLPYWKTEGNVQTDPNINFLGTKDIQDLVIRTSNTERIRVTSTGEVIVYGIIMLTDVQVENLLTSTIMVEDYAELSGPLLVNGPADFEDVVSIKKMTSTKDLNVLNDASIQGHLDVGADARFQKNVRINEDVRVIGGATIREDVTMDKNLSIGNNISISNDASIGNNLNVVGAVQAKALNAESLNVAGDTKLDGNLTVTDTTTSNLIISQSDIIAQRDMNIGHQLTVDDSSTFKKNVNIQENLFIDNDVSVGNNLNVEGTLQTDVLLAESLNVLGSTTLEGNLKVNGSTISEGLISQKDIIAKRNIEAGHQLTVEDSAKFNGVVHVEVDNYNNEKPIFNIIGSSDNHLVHIENIDAQQGDGLSIKLGRTIPNKNNHFITFLSGEDYMAGRIEGYDITTDLVDFPVPSKEAWTELGCLSLNIYEMTNPVLQATRAAWDLGIVPLWNEEAAIPELKINKGALFGGLNIPDVKIAAGQLGTIDIKKISIDKGDWFDKSIASIRVAVPDDDITLFKGYNQPIPSEPIDLAQLPDVPELPQSDWTILKEFNFSDEWGKVEPIGSITKNIEGCAEKPFEFFPDFNLNMEATYPKLYDYSFFLSEFVQANNAQELVPSGFKPQDFALAIAKWGVLTAAKHRGVTYGSEGADYAEWLERKDAEEQMKYGQIVGVKNGKISLNTEDAEQIMSISLAPAVVGNLPDEASKGNYEMVGFMGQVPVWVFGTCKAGDYIIPSGYHDGYGKAISPENLKVEHMDKILGRALEDSQTGVIDMVNTIIGVKTNEWAEIFKQQDQRIKELEAQIHTLESMQSEIAALKAHLGISENAEIQEASK